MSCFPIFIISSSAICFNLFDRILRVDLYRSEWNIVLEHNRVRFVGETSPTLVQTIPLIRMQQASLTGFPNKSHPETQRKVPHTSAVIII